MRAAGTAHVAGRDGLTHRRADPPSSRSQVQLMVARLAQFETDLLISITRPKTAAVGPEEAATDKALALSILDSIEIRDQGLFG